MEDDFLPLNSKQTLRTYSKASKKASGEGAKQPRLCLDEEPLKEKVEKLPLTTKNAVKLLLEGTLQSKVCRYCLNVTTELSSLDQILQVANNGSLYKVAIKDMVASFHPFKVAKDPNFPNKICDKCLDRTLSAYLFAQQCERAERALYNCFEDIYEKSEKLDPLERPHKRGRQKKNPNHNVLHAEHGHVIDYADSLIHLVHRSSAPLTVQTPIGEFECLKCCELLPNLESLWNHTRSHPKSMWFNCRLCGQSYAKLYQIKKHLRTNHSKPEDSSSISQFTCKTCGVTSQNYYEHLLHLEKHKFKVVMQHLVSKGMDKLCSICFNKRDKMVSLGNTVCLHGGTPELSGDRTLYNVLSSTLPQMNILDNYSGTKICETCVNHAVTSYVFINHTYFVRNRLNTCISYMLDNLDTIKDSDKNICIEIGESAIMKTSDTFDDTMFTEEGNIDESKLQVDVLEDEFRVKSEGESEAESDLIKLEPKQEPVDNSCPQESLINGYQRQNPLRNEFLKLKTKPKLRQAMFTCPVCSKHFISDYFLKRHITKHYPKITACDVCHKHFNSKFDLYEHRKMAHILDARFTSCKICGRCYINADKLKSHELKHKANSCQLCDKRFLSQKHFMDHMHRHITKIGTVMKKYKQNCSFCEKDCPNDNEFSLHVNKVHLQIKPYSCDMCERNFYTEYNLRSHKRVHSLRSKEKCNFCNKILYSRKMLVIHIRKHIGETPFFCQICNQSFYSQFKLKEHMRVLHGGRFCCKFCKIAFATKKGLKEHVNIAHNSWI